MICGKCGRELPGDGSFCPNCDGVDTTVHRNSLKANLMAAASLITGILSLFGLNLLPGLLAVILGICSRKECDRQGIATAGIVCGVIGLIVALFVMILFRQVAPPSI